MASDQILLVDAMAEVIDSMRDVGTIAASQEVTPGVYTISSANELKNKEVVSINDVEYIITDVTESSFTINAATGIDFTSNIWKALAPYYKHGHPIEIVNTLSQQSKGIFDYKKYPLICLFQDFQSSVNVANDYLFSEASINIAIVNFTKKQIRASERYDLNYRDVLYPIYFELIESINESDYFSTVEPKGFNHTLIEALYYGTSTENGNTANKMNDPLDALLLNNSDLKLVNTRC